MGAALIYEQEKGQTDRVAVAFTVNVGVATTLAAVIFAAAGPINDFFFHGANNVAMFQVVAALIFIKGLGQVPDSLLRRDMDFRRRVRADFTRSLGRFVVSVALLAAGVGPISMIIGVTVAEILAVAVTWW